MRPQGFNYSLGNTLLVDESMVADITLLRSPDMAPVRRSFGKPETALKLRRQDVYLELRHRHVLSRTHRHARDLNQPHELETHMKHLSSPRAEGAGTSSFALACAHLTR
jgi:hypothetical protein